MRRARPSPLSLLLAAAGLAPAAGCHLGAHRPGEVVQQAGQGGDYRDAGPFAVARHRVWAPARYTDVVDAWVYYPSTADGWFDASQGARPLVILVQEDGEAPESFNWLATHLASWGVTVASPEHLLNDPSLASDNARWVRAELADLSAREGTWLSGGVDEARLGLVRFDVEGDELQTLDEDQAYKTLSLVGAEPRSPSTSPITATVLLVDGGQDCIADASSGWENYETRRYLATLEGVSHSQWIDASALGGLASGGEDCPDEDPECDPVLCEATISGPEARRIARGVVAAFHAAELAGDDDDALTDTLASWAGLTLQEAEPTPTAAP